HLAPRRYCGRNPGALAKISPVFSYSFITWLGDRPSIAKTGGCFLRIDRTLRDHAHHPGERHEKKTAPTRLARDSSPGGLNPACLRLERDGGLLRQAPFLGLEGCQAGDRGQ